MRTVAAGIGTICFLLASCKEEPRRTAAPAATVPTGSSAPTQAAAPQAAAAKAQAITRRVLSAATLDDAVQVIKPYMTDTFNESSPGALLLAVWSAKNLKWSELQKLPSTKYSLVMKDPDEERGKLMCARGRVIEIQAEKTETGKVFTGGLFAGTKIVRFIAVGSSGDLVAKSWAGICGVVIGKQSYQNSMGGTAHAVFLVGMFGLPENKQS